MSALSGAGSPGEPDQDLVPEQEGQAQEVSRGERGASADAGGPGPLQPLHPPRGRGAHRVLVVSFTRRQTRVPSSVRESTQVFSNER